MTDYDLLVWGALATDGAPVDVGIAGGVIVAIGEGLDPGAAREWIDASGLLVLPGGIDPHVHLNEPGPRTEWEGWATGTAALAAGGITTTVEMPLNASPPTTTASAFDAKRAAASDRSRIDFGLWGGVIPGNRAELPALAARGVTGFKAFMSNSGVADFPASDERTLAEAMATIAALPVALPLAVHAESEVITRERATAAQAAGRTAVDDYLDSRPVQAETEAIAQAISLAQRTGCPLHIVHISSAEGVALVTAARAAGLDVSCEVTVHHLLLCDADARALGAVAKCAPPLRPREQGDALWRSLAAGEIGFVVSDHSPSPPELKTGDAFTAWGGIAGAQSTLELIVGESPERLAADELVRVLAGGAAERFRLTGKGALRVGMDADLTLVDTGRERELEAAELRYRHRISPYVGRTLGARVQTTILRGRVIYADGELRGRPHGRLVTPGAPRPSQ